MDTTNNRNTRGLIDYTKCRAAVPHSTKRYPATSSISSVSFDGSGSGSVSVGLSKQTQDSKGPSSPRSRPSLEKVDSSRIVFKVKQNSKPIKGEHGSTEDRRSPNKYCPPPITAKSGKIPPLLASMKSFDTYDTIPNTVSSWSPNTGTTDVSKARSPKKASQRKADEQRLKRGEISLSEFLESPHRRKPKLTMGAATTNDGISKIIPRRMASDACGDSILKQMYDELKRVREPPGSPSREAPGRQRSSGSTNLGQMSETSGRPPRMNLHETYTEEDSRSPRQAPRRKKSTDSTGSVQSLRRVRSDSTEELKTIVDNECGGRSPYSSPRRTNSRHSSLSSSSASGSPRLKRIATNDDEDAASVPRESPTREPMQSPYRTPTRKPSVGWSSPRRRDVRKSDVGPLTPRRSAKGDVAPVTPRKTSSPTKSSSPSSCLHFTPNRDNSGVGGSGSGSPNDVETGNQMAQPIPCTPTKKNASADEMLQYQLNPAPLVTPTVDGNPRHLYRRPSLVMGGSECMGSPIIASPTRQASGRTLKSNKKDYVKQRRRASLSDSILTGDNGGERRPVRQCVSMTSGEVSARGKGSSPHRSKKAHINDCRHVLTVFQPSCESSPLTSPRASPRRKKNIPRLPESVMQY